MAWTRAVCGRLEMRYRYSKDIVYNNFPFVTPECHTDSELLRNSRNQEKSTETPSGVSNPCDNLPHCTQAQADKIEKTAQAILDARAKYPELSLAELYGENMFMFPELEKAHKENDHAVLQAYGFSPDLTESEISDRLFEMYERLTQEK